MSGWVGCGIRQISFGLEKAEYHTRKRPQLASVGGDEIGEGLLQGLNRNLVKYFVGKGVDQEFLGAGSIDASTLQIKYFVGVELTDGCAVGTLYIVSNDFKLRFCIDSRFWR